MTTSLANQQDYIRVSDRADAHHDMTDISGKNAATGEKNTMFTFNINPPLTNGFLGNLLKNSSFKMPI